MMEGTCFDRFETLSRVCLTGPHLAAILPGIHLPGFDSRGAGVPAAVMVPSG